MSTFMQACPSGHAQSVLELYSTPLPVGPLRPPPSAPPPPMPPPSCSLLRCIPLPPTSEFTKPLPPDVNQRLKLIVGSVPALGRNSRVIDVGSGTGCLIPHLEARGVKDILSVDLSEVMLAEVSSRYSKAGTLGNDQGGWVHGRMHRCGCACVVGQAGIPPPSITLFMSRPPLGLL